jgi:hypothetical protein
MYLAKHRLSFPSINRWMSLVLTPRIYKYSTNALCSGFRRLKNFSVMFEIENSGFIAIDRPLPVNTAIFTKPLLPRLYRIYDSPSTKTSIFLQVFLSAYFWGRLRPIIVQESIDVGSHRPGPDRSVTNGQDS